MISVDTYGNGQNRKLLGFEDKRTTRQEYEGSRKKKKIPLGGLETSKRHQNIHNELRTQSSI
jgi:hypothetical protein